MTPPFQSLTSFPRRLLNLGCRLLPVMILLLSLQNGLAQFTNTGSLYAPATQGLPDAGPSMLRVFGALAAVIGIFLGGVWMYRNGRQLAFRRGRAPRLNILEVRSLGGRQAIYVVGYDQERFLLASSPAGINMLSKLPLATESCQPAPSGAADEGGEGSFAQTLARMLKGQPPLEGGSGGKKP